MDTRTVAALLLKVAGLILIGACVTQLPSYFPVRFDGSAWSPVESFAAAALTIGPAAVLGICLWFFPGTIANKMIVSGEPSLQPIESSAIFLVAISVLGLFLLAHGITDLVYHVATLVQVQRLSPGMSVVPATIFAGAIASTVEALIGLFFCIGRKGVARLIERMRG